MDAVGESPATVLFGVPDIDVPQSAVLSSLAEVEQLARERNRAEVFPHPSVLMLREVVESAISERDNTVVAEARD